MLATELVREIQNEKWGEEGDSPTETPLWRDRQEWYITSGASWQAYEALLAKMGDSAGYRVAYLDGILEIMSPSRRHEGEKKRIATLLEVYFEETDTEYFPLGSTTFRQEERRGGAEPDESYCIGADKEFPDLVIEVVVSSGGTDKLEIYRRLQVREVWFWRGKGFSVFRLQGDRYQAIARSEILPNLDLNALAEYVGYPSQLEAVKAFRREISNRL